MKRYLAFCGEYYYSQGGWVDFLESFNTVEEAVVVLEARELNSRQYALHRPQWDNMWAHVVDSTTGDYLWDEDRGYVTNESD